LDFSDSRDNYLNNVNDNTNPKFGENIIILKRVTSIRQIRNTEKEWVRLCYKEAILKGFTMVNDIQCYIASKTKIWIERSGIEFLKKSEEEENKKWYFNLARDQFAYVGVYRKTIDEIEEYKKEMWSVITDPEATNTEKIQATKELHNLTKTHTLLIRDLPFVTNLSKYYNHDLVNANSRSQQTGSQKTIEDEKSEKEIIERKVSERFRKMVEDSALFTSEQKHKMGIIASTNEDEKITDSVMEDMRKQLVSTPKDILESINNKAYQESIKKIKEIMED
jgi:hypothetical protein